MMYKNVNYPTSCKGNILTKFFASSVKSSFQRFYSFFFYQHRNSIWTAKNNETLVKNTFVKCEKLYLFFYLKTKFNVLLAHDQILPPFVLDGGITLNSAEVLEINTTTPSVKVVNCSTSCNYNASHENRSSSGYTVPVAVIKFTGDIVFNSNSTGKVVGEYALSMTSLNGSIYIQTDINMTCGEMQLDTTCLGGFTQSAAGKLVRSTALTSVYQGKHSSLISCFLFQLLLFWMQHLFMTFIGCFMVF